MDLKNQIELELYFADHFETVLFPVLADIYLRQEDFRRARKVCNIGLGYHENDSAGRFVLAPVEKAEGNLKEAEKELHHVIKYSPDHSAAAIMLCEIQTVLGRAPSRLLKSWKRVLDLDPTNQIAVEFVLKIEGDKEKQVGKKQKGFRLQVGKKVCRLQVEKCIFKMFADSVFFFKIKLKKNQKF